MFEDGDGLGNGCGDYEEGDGGGFGWYSFIYGDSVRDIDESSCSDPCGNSYQDTYDENQ